MRHSLTALLLLLAAALALPSPGLAQDPAGGGQITACTSAIEGAVACMSEKLCLCRFDPGGTLTGRPPRHRWDCGIERPSCGTVPADLYGGQSQVPIAPIQPQVLIPYGAGPQPYPVNPYAGGRPAYPAAPYPGPPHGAWR